VLYSQALGRRVSVCGSLCLGGGEMGGRWVGVVFWGWFLAGGTVSVQFCGWCGVVLLLALGGCCGAGRGRMRVLVLVLLKHRSRLE